MVTEENVPGRYMLEYRGVECPICNLISEDLKSIYRCKANVATMFMTSDFRKKYTDVHCSIFSFSVGWKLSKIKV